MPLPGDLNKITVTATYDDGSGSPLVGNVTFTPAADLVDSTGRVILRAVAIPTPVVGGIMTPPSLVCTDNANISPTGWTWNVVEYLGGTGSNLPTRSYSILLPHTLGSTVDLSALAPTVPQPGVTTYLLGPNNLADLQSAATARTNLGLASGATAAIDATATDIQPLGTQAAGATGKLADAGHVHPTAGVVLTSAAATTVQPGTAYGTASAVGTAATYAREDHQHGTVSLASTAPATTEGIGQGAAVGTAATPARADHVHPMAAAAAPTNSAVTDSAATGNASTFAASNHVHGREGFGTVTALAAFGAASSNGTAATVSHSDHVHGSPALPVATTSGAGVVQLDGAAGDIQALGTAAAGSVGKAADAGHVHPTAGVVLASQLPLSIANGGTGTAVAPAVGTSPLATSATAAAWLPAGPVANVRAYGAVGNGRKITDAGITASANTLTSNTANFTAADVGKTVMIVGAGTGGLPLVTTINGFTNATTVTATANAAATVSGATAWYGTDDSAALTAAHNAALNAANGGAVYYPGGIYLSLAAIPCTNTSGTVIRVFGDSPRTTAVVAPSSNALDLGGNYVKGGWELDHIAIVAYGGDCIHNANLNQAYIHHANLDQYDPTHAILTMTATGSLILLTVDQCNSTVWTPAGSSRTIDAWSCVAQGGSTLANCTWSRVNFQNYSVPGGGAPDNAKYQIRLQATGSSGHHNTHQHQAVRDCYFEQCFGGEIISLSGGALTIDGCRHWDTYNSSQFGNQTVGNHLIRIGEDPNGTVPSWRTTISNWGRDTTANGVNGTSLWDLYFESTTLDTTLIGLETRAVPGTPTPVYVNLNGSDVVSIGHQWSSGGNQNSGTNFSNNTGASILLTDGNVQFSGSLIGASTPNIALPSDHGFIAWSFDPANNAGTSAFTVGTLYLIAMYVRAATTISSISLAYGTTLGAGLANSFVGLYNSSGTLLSGSADQSSAWMTTAGTNGGIKTASLTTAQAVAPGWYWAAALVGAATTSPVWGRGGTNPIGFMNIGLGLNTRFGTLGTASTPAAPFTALPASFTPASANITIPGAPFWAAVK